MFSDKTCLDDKGKTLSDLCSIIPKQKTFSQRLKEWLKQ
jgi:hypothetical protein